ncbi:MAG: hypothetical protein IJI67_08515 [Clostridia bacterium]|nr:hypothetical protein [Clostridia bacterium]
MSKKVLAVLLMAVVALFALSACKSGNKTTTAKADSKTTASADSGNTEQKKKEEAADKEASDKSGTTKSGNSDAKTDSKSKETAGDNSGSKEEATTKKGEKTTAKQEKEAAVKKEDTDGWQRTKDGSVVKGDVTADVVNYGKTTVDEGEQLIKELVKAGLSKSKKLSSEKSGSVVTYKYSGKRMGNDDVEYIKFQFIVENGRGYLVTVIAQNESDMDTDISYLTKNLAKLAK